MTLMKGGRTGETDQRPRIDSCLCHSRRNDDQFGLFVLPGLAHARAGPAVVLSYFLAGLLAMGGLLSIAELTTAMPKAGADYFSISRSMGPAMGTVAGCSVGSACR